MKVIIDTNIILDVYLNREPFAVDSAEVLKLSEAKKTSASITANTVTDVYYILGKQLKDDIRLRELLAKLLIIIDVTDVLGSDIKKAFELPVEDYEDALIVQCAMRTKANYIVTRNESDFAKSTVPVISPAEFLGKFFNS